MSSLNKTSTFIENQLPGFIRGNPEYTLFVQFLQKYYEFLELPGNPVYELRRAQENYDIDLARKTLLRYFKDKILPSFPEETELSTEKIVKAARDFYAKKGTPDSFKFLFRILYNQEVDIFLPKTNILRASDGKWQIPQAIRISFADRSLLLSGNVTVNTATANVVDYIGSLAATGLAANSYIRVGKERRKVVAVNTTSNKINVDVAFANTADAIANGVIYRSGNNIYRLFPNDNALFDYTLLKNKVAIGVNSRTSCIIENVFRTYDPDSGQEIAELFVSNVNRQFQIGEDLQIEYQDSSGATKIFTTKIISLVSNVVLLKDRFNNTFGGNEYLTGDPVVFFGGLDKTTDQAKKAIAVVDDVTTGGIDVVRLNKRGFFFRDEANGGLIQIQSQTGVGANLIIQDIYTDGGFSNSRVFSYATDAIIYKKDILLNDNDYEFDNVTNIIGLTINPGNSNISVNLSTTTYTPSRINDYYKSFILNVTSGTGAGESSQIVFYNGNTKIAFLDPPLTVSLDATSNVKIVANAQTEIGRAMTYDFFTMGKIKTLDLLNPGTLFAEPPTFDIISTFDTDYSLDAGFQYISGTDFYGYDPDSFPSPSIKLNSSNGQFSLANGFYNGTRLFVDTGDSAHYATVTDYIVTNSATPANVKTVFLDRKFENNVNPLNINRFNLFFDYRADVRNVGRIGGVEVISGGSGYSSADKIVFLGTGSGAQGSPIVTPTGKIVEISITNHGEGYYGPTSAVVTNSTGGPSGGSGANFIVWGMSDGEAIAATTTDVGKIKTFKILNRGFGYANTPNVSLKVVDVFATNAGNLESKIISGDLVWQGNANIAASDTNFTAVVDDVYDLPGTSNTILRLYNYNGSLGAGILYANIATGNITFSNTAHIGSYSFKGIYTANERIYPYFYGNGLAKARAEFLNGLIKYQGYYLNTDGFPSADQRLQNDDYYHNYSYEIQSEKSLDDYRSTVYEVIHPAGTQLLSKYLIKDTVNVQRESISNVVSSNTVGGTISAVFNTVDLSGSGAAALAAAANVGDIIIINSTNDSANVERQVIRQITSVSPTVTVDNPMEKYGDGELRLVFQSNIVKVIGNTFPVLDTLRSGDLISIFTPAGPYPETITNISGTNLTISNGFPFANQNVAYSILNTFTDVPYRLIKQIG